MDVKERELKLWNNLLEHEARRECAIDHWVGELSGHAKALCRLGIIDEEELREMLDLADAAYAHVSEELVHQEWLQSGRPAR
ncbi:MULTISPECIES: hypothetical protein [Pseudomonas]|uniref:Uncharacterized protein n=1 Tax=Pseudomonas syringae pv. papulans TaxID=83963 RepID=A0AA43DYE4_PSESX|nr:MULTISPECIES: hypothetical protein [Pseudomonas]MDH4603710.1 hypothetical protein [Pseudomonas syringae pv. papulans]MDH4625521.1 hypothetical protein [Pseudomonas syringae pv. papulans]